MGRIPSSTNIAAVTYSPTTTKLQYHQHDMGLATGIGTVNRAFPHHYHHRKTLQTTHTQTQPHPSGRVLGPCVVVVQEPYSEREHQRVVTHQKNFMQQSRTHQPTKGLCE